MRAVLIPAVLAALLAAGGVGEAGTTQAVPDLGPIVHRLVESGVPEQRLVIGDEAAWRRFWQRFEPSAAPPAFDFAANALAIYLMGLQRSGGYSAHVVETRRDGDAVVVRVLRCHPAPGSTQVSELTAPYAIAAVPPHVRVRWEIDKKSIGDGATCP